MERGRHSCGGWWDVLSCALVVELLGNTRFHSESAEKPNVGRAGCTHVLEMSFVVDAEREQMWVPRVVPMPTEAGRRQVKREKAVVQRFGDIATGCTRLRLEDGGWMMEDGLQYCKMLPAKIGIASNGLPSFTPPIASSTRGSPDHS